MIRLTRSPRKPRRGALLARFVFALCGLALITCAAGGWTPAGQLSPAGGSNAPQSWRDRLETWVRAVDTHEPGESDASTIAVGTWSEDDLAQLRSDLFALLAIHSRESGRTGPSEVPGGVVPTITYKSVPLTLSGLRALLGLSGSGTPPGGVNRLLERGAILHADIAMHGDPYFRGRAGCAATPSVLALDGNRVGQGCLGIHWPHARALLDAVSPDPARDPAVRLWYHATIAYLLEHWDYANANPQIEHARLLFPRDAGILFEHGYFHETLAAPFLESVAAESGAALQPKADHLHEAESLLRSAIAAAPEFAEARIRLGHVLTELGRPRDAVDELGRAGSVSEPAELHYFAELFLGEAEQLLAHVERAREHYTAASKVFPAAQSPRLALALLAVQGGDRANAERVMKPVVSLARDNPYRVDPWWAYPKWQAKSSAALLEDLYLPFRTGDAR